MVEKAVAKTYLVKKGTSKGAFFKNGAHSKAIIGLKIMMNTSGWDIR